MEPLDLRVLGQLEIRRDGRPVPVPAGRRRRVLAALVLRVGDVVGTDALVEAGWEEDLPADPRAALHTVVSRLRSLLGGSALRAEPAGYRLVAPSEAVDAHRFERLYLEATASSPQHAARLLDEALTLWRGRPYAELADHHFAATEVQRLELLRADVLEERARAAIDSGRPADAVRPLETLLSDHPFRETAVGLLMAAMRDSGRAGEALTRYRSHRRLIAEELGLDPAPALRRLERQIAADGAPSTDSSGHATVPSWVDTSTAFLGREEECYALESAVASSRVVSVTGPGGVGKTRLVAETLPSLARRTQLPVTVVELAPVGPGRLDGAVAAALRIGPGTSVRAALVDHLRSRGAVLVLDGCEHLLDEVAALADLVSRRCRSVRLVVTSRQRLGIRNEQVLPLSPLPVQAPDTSPGEAEPAAAVRVLLDRVRRVRPGFRTSTETLAAASDICRRLDGLPLALEVAATRAAALGIVEVREQLARSLSVIDEPGDGPGTLGQVVDWSYQLLDEAQQSLFTGLSVFPDRFDHTAAAALASGKGPATGDQPRGLLTALVEASLLSVQDGTTGRTYRMLAVIREKAARLLAASGREQDVRRAHAAWVVDLTSRAASDCTGPGAAIAMARLARNRADVAQALDWSLAQQELGIAADIAAAVGMCPHWTAGPQLGGLLARVGDSCLATPGPWSAAGLGAAGAALADLGDVDRSRELCRLGRQLPGDTTKDYLATKGLGVALLYAGEHEASARCWREIIECRELSLALTAEAHSSLSLIARYTGDIETAREESRLALLLAETAGASPVHAFAMYAAGECAEEPDGSIRLLTSAAEIAASVGADHVGHVSRVALLGVLVRAARFDAAATVAAPLVQDLRRAGAWPQLWTVARILAELQSGTGRPQEAAFLLAVADAAPSAPPAAGEDVGRYEQLRARLREHIGADLDARLATAAAGVSREQVADRMTVFAEQLGPAAPG